MYIDGLVHDCGNSSVAAVSHQAIDMKIRQNWLTLPGFLADCDVVDNDISKELFHFLKIEWW